MGKSNLQPGKATKHPRFELRETQVPQVGIGCQSSFPLWDSNVAQESSSCSLAKPQTCNFGSAQYADSKRGVHGAVGLGAWMRLGCCPTFIRHSCTGHRAQWWSDETSGQDTKFGDHLVSSSRCPDCFVQARASLRRDFCAPLGSDGFRSFQDIWITRNSVSGSRTPRAPRAVGGRPDGPAGARGHHAVRLEPHLRPVADDPHTKLINDGLCRIHRGTE